jgi:H+-translocating NAD(P) transhydrogenase
LFLSCAQRPTDPPSYSHFYLIPTAALIGGYLGLKGMGFDHMHQIAYITSGVYCIGGIAAMSSMESSRVGNPIAMIGVSTGIAATLGLISQTLPPAQFLPVFGQIAACSLAGSAVGFSMANGLAPTQLPETVALFHRYFAIRLHAFVRWFQAM